MRKAVLYLLALALIAGLACTPVSAEGTWKFCIVEQIVGLEYTSINGIPDCNSPVKFDHPIDTLVVSDEIDAVTIVFQPVAGATTTLTITKADIGRLNAWAEENHHHGGIPTIWAWGGVDTYDVDGG